MVTVNQLRSLKPGDVIYRKSQRHTVIRLNDLNQIIATYKTYGSAVFPISDFQAAFIDRIVPKEKVRARANKPAYDYAYSSGGRCLEGEQHDCTVRALAIALETPYQWAHQFMAANGREFGKGANTRCYRSAEYNGHKLVVAAQEFPAQGEGIRLTVKGWIKSGILPDRCILRIRKHVFAVVNGTVVDTFKPGPRSIVDTIWEVVKL